MKFVVFNVQVAIADDADIAVVQDKLEDTLRSERQHWFGGEVSLKGSRGNNQEQRSCIVCGRPVIGRRADAKYCSGACRSREMTARAEKKRRLKLVHG